MKATSDTKLRPYKIALIVDNPKRDLRGLCILAEILADQGHELFIVPMYQQGYELPRIAPDMVVVNYARVANEDVLRTYKACGYRVCVLDTEGGIFTEDSLDSPENAAKDFHKNGYYQLVDDYCFWGQATCDAFKAHSGLDAAQLAVTGSPRYDVGSAPYHDMLHFPVSGQVLVNTNFSAINPKFTRSYEDELAIFASQGWDMTYLERFFLDMKQVLPLYQGAILQAAKALPETQFQIRVHPFESEASYHEFFKDQPNVLIDSRGDIFDVISASEVIVHLNCGSAIDSVRLNKIPIQMEFLNTEVMRAHTPLPGKISCLAQSVEDLVRLIDRAAERKAAFAALDVAELITPYFHHSDGKAGERAASFIIHRLRASNSQARRSLSAALTGGRSRLSFARAILGVMNLFLGGRLASWIGHFAKPLRRDKSFTKDQVEAHFQALSAARERAGSYHCQHARALFFTQFSSIRIHRHDR